MSKATPKKRKRIKAGSDSGDDFRLPDDDEATRQKSKRVKKPTTDYSELDFDFGDSSSAEEEKFRLPAITSPSPFELPVPKNVTQRRHQEFCAECNRSSGTLHSCETCVGEWHIPAPHTWRQN